MSSWESHFLCHPEGAILYVILREPFLYAILREPFFYVILREPSFYVILREPFFYVILREPFFYVILGEPFFYVILRERSEPKDLPAARCVNQQVYKLNQAKKHASS